MLKKLASYTAYMFIATSAIKLISFAVNMLGAKFRTREDFGDYGTYVLIYGLILSATTMGVSVSVSAPLNDTGNHR